LGGDTRPKAPKVVTLMSVSQKSAPAGDGKLERILGDLRKLPLLPAVAQQAVAMANDKNATLQEFTSLIEKDITLASSILKLANSSTYNCSQPIEGLDQAVARLGFRECQSLIFAASVGNLYQQVDPLTKGRCAVLWQHCFLTACLCRRLNKELKYDFRGEEFTAGLLHDLGRILLAVSFPNLFEAADPMDFLEAQGTRQKEQDILETDHCQLGTQYAQQNRLPAPAVASIRFHHDLTEARDHRGLLGLVASADHMANYMQRGEKPENYDVRANPGFALLGADWSDAQKSTFERMVPRIMTDTMSAASEPKKACPSGNILRPVKPVGNEFQAKKPASGTFRTWLGI
jgi:HD-like signal output (HDOD) protein